MNNILKPCLVKKTTLAIPLLLYGYGNWKMKQKGYIETEYTGDEIY
jgi:hypothetical protein